MMKRYLTKAILLGCIMSTMAWAIDKIDPTKPPNLAVVHDNAFILSAIVIAADRKIAVINGKIVHEGDMINDTRVMSITADHVELEGPNGKINLVLTDMYPARLLKTIR